MQWFFFLHHVRLFFFFLFLLIRQGVIPKFQSGPPQSGHWPIAVKKNLKRRGGRGIARECPASLGADFQGKRRLRKFET